MVRKCRLLQISLISTLPNLQETMVGKTGFAESNFQMDSLNTSKGFATTTELTKNFHKMISSHLDLRNSSNM